jgi:hypothetical protein
MTKFNDDWKHYMETVYPEGMVEEQKKQVYLAFHAGAVVMLTSILEAVRDNEGDMKASMGAITKLKEEVFGGCDDFCNQIKQSN